MVGMPVGEATADEVLVEVVRENAQTEVPPAPLLSIRPGSDIPTGVQQGIQIPVGAQRVHSAEDAALQLIPMIDGTDDVIPAAEWTYVLAAAFPTIEDGVRAEAIPAAWQGQWSPEFKGRTLLVSPETAAVFRALWGEEARHKVQVVDEEQLLKMVWEDDSCWALLPFEQLSPRWKVLRVSGQSPLDDVFTPQQYGLTVTFGWQGTEQAMTAWTQMADEQSPIVKNCNADRLTSVVMSGTTAMVRVMAFKMEENGVTYPGEKVVDWLQSADIVHVSNEVPMFADCPPAVPLREEQRFCSAPNYVELFHYLGVDLVELTGNHILDWGAEAFAETLALYEENGLPYYGGGLDEEGARQPHLVEHNGNRLAFIGCNAAGPDNVLADSDQPGAAPCDIAWLAAEVQQLRGNGYLPIVTFQHYELEDYEPVSKQRVDLLRIANEGPVIVSGSQAHFPQTMTFVDDTFVHYGLGNFLFDQMFDGNRRGFLDRHIFYKGEYISTELLTIILEDGSQPRPMNGAERKALLETIFAKSNWNQSQ